MKTVPPAGTNAPARALQPCGTWGAYRRHLRAGETPCESCREAARTSCRRDQCTQCGKPVQCRRESSSDTLTCMDCRCQTPSARGLRKHPLYRTWEAMLARCENPKHRSYRRYGGRGISVCQRWHDLTNFIADMERLGPRAPGMTMDRINNDGNYEPGNVRWATARQQSANKRTPIQPCGTCAGYLRHQRAGEQACEPCLAARRDDARARRAAARRATA
jgi:hypothetical protein